MQIRTLIEPSEGKVGRLCFMYSDYCLNNRPFLSPELFSDFVTPYLTKLVQGYRNMGFYVIKHTEGNHD